MVLKVWAAFKQHLLSEVESAFFPTRYFSDYHEECYRLPMSHPWHLKREQAMRPWTLPEDHMMYRCVLEMEEPSQGPPPWLRLLLRHPLQSIAKSDFVSAAGARVSFWRDEAGIIWMATNKWGLGKVVAGPLTQEKF